MTRLQKPAFPLMSWVGTPRSPSVGALFLLWLQVRCDWNFLGLQKPTGQHYYFNFIDTSFPWHSFQFHYTPLLLSMAAGLWKDGQKPHQKSSERCMWKKGSHASASASLMLYISGFWAGKLRSNTFIRALTQLHARDVARDWQTLHSHNLTCNQCWSHCGSYSSGTSSEQDFCSDHVIKSFLILVGNNSTVFTCKHLWTNHPAVSSTVLAPSLVSWSQTPTFRGFARYLTTHMGKANSLHWSSWLDHYSIVFTTVCIFIPKRFCFACVWLCACACMASWRTQSASAGWGLIKSWIWTQLWREVEMAHSLAD